MKNEARHSLLVSVSLEGSMKKGGCMGGRNTHCYISHFRADFIISMSIFLFPYLWKGLSGFFFPYNSRIWIKILIVYRVYKVYRRASTSFRRLIYNNTKQPHFSLFEHNNTLWSSSLCIWLHCAGTSFLWIPNFFLAIQSRVVSGLLLWHNTFRRHLYINP